MEIYSPFIRLLPVESLGRESFFRISSHSSHCLFRFQSWMRLDSMRRLRPAVKGYSRINRHSRASLRSGLTFLVSSSILSLGAASLIQSLPGGYIPRVEKERDRLVAVDNILNYRLLLENITYISSFLVPQPMIGDETRDFYRINPQS